jgi:hypothetical protein
MEIIISARHWPTCNTLVIFVKNITDIASEFNVIVPADKVIKAQISNFIGVQFIRIIRSGKNFAVV